MALVKAKFVVCVDTGDNVDLQLRKLYRVKQDRKSAEEGLVRVIDDSGEDYLYPPEFFVPVRSAPAAAKVVQQID